MTQKSIGNRKDIKENIFTQGKKKKKKSLKNEKKNPKHLMKCYENNRSR